MIGLKNKNIFHYHVMRVNPTRAVYHLPACVYAHIKIVSNIIHTQRLAHYTIDIPAAFALGYLFSIFDWYRVASTKTPLLAGQYLKHFGPLWTDNDNILGVLNVYFSAVYLNRSPHREVYRYVHLTKYLSFVKTKFHNMCSFFDISAKRTKLVLSTSCGKLFLIRLNVYICVLE